MINKFQAISYLVATLLLTNYFGWTSIPWILLQIPATVIAVIWIYAIIMASIITIKNYK